MIEIQEMEMQENCVVLVGVNTGIPEDEFDHSLKELKSLAKACNKKTVGIVTQNMESPNQAFYVGSGKVSAKRRMTVYVQKTIYDLEEIYLAREKFNSEIKPSLLSNHYNSETLKQEIEAFKTRIKINDKSISELEKN